MGLLNWLLPKTRMRSAGRRSKVLAAVGEALAEKPTKISDVSHLPERKSVILHAFLEEIRRERDPDQRILLIWCCEQLADFQSLTPNQEIVLRRLQFAADHVDSLPAADVRELALEQTEELDELERNVETERAKLKALCRRVAEASA